MSALDKEFWISAVDKLVFAFEESELQLCSYDGAIGDGDHGTSMLHGFREAQKSLHDAHPTDVGEVICRTGEAFLEKVGGVTGIVFGSLFVAVGEGAAGLLDTDAATLYYMFALGLAAVKQRGKATEGDKTMVDALSPAVAALRTAAEERDTAEVALARGAQAAEVGMKATVPMQAKVGRARYQSEKGSGHIDAGAASVCLFFQTLSQAAVTRKLPPT